MEPQRLGRIRVTLGWLSLVLSGGVKGPIIECDAPTDLEVLSCVPDRFEFMGAGWLICESESFSEVYEGDQIPIYGPYTYKYSEPK